MVKTTLQILDNGSLPSASCVVRYSVRKSNAEYPRTSSISPQIQPSQSLGNLHQMPFLLILLRIRTPSHPMLFLLQNFELKLFEQQVPVQILQRWKVLEPKIRTILDVVQEKIVNFLRELLMNRVEWWASLESRTSSGQSS